MTICLVSQQYPPETARGGVGTQTWNKATTLARLGHTVHVLSRTKAASPSVACEEDGRLTVHRLPLEPAAPGETYEESVYWVRYAWAVRQELERLHERYDFDVINFPEWGAEGFAYLAQRPGGAHLPAVVHLHGPLSMFSERIGWPSRDSMLYRLGTAMEDTSIELADGLLASSAHIAEYIAARHRRPLESIDVVHTGIDCDRFCPAPHVRPNRRPTVLFVGNIARNKGITFLFEAIMRLRHRYPEIRLVLAGAGDGHLLESFQRRAHAVGADQILDIRGFVARDQLPELYREADVFASPAEYELGVANVYVEAMSCGCPVIASTAGGAREAVLDGQTGLLVPPADVDALVSSLDRLLGETELRTRMSVAARSWVEEYFSLDRYIHRVVTAYQKAIERVSATQSA